VTEYLFRNEDLINEVIDTAIEDNTFRSDDLEFTFAARVRTPECAAVSCSSEMLAGPSHLTYIQSQIFLSFAFVMIQKSS
jgi:hypothetical protein